MLYLLVATIFSCLLYLLMVFTSASIGQLFSQHKIAASVIAGVVLYFAEQIISTIIMVASGYVMLMNDMSTDSSTIPDLFRCILYAVNTDRHLFGHFECHLLRSVLPDYQKTYQSGYKRVPYGTRKKRNVKQASPVRHSVFCTLLFAA